MVSNENAAQAAIASLEFNLDGYEIKAKTSKASVYDSLYAAIPAMEVGKLYQLTAEMGYNAERSAQLNKNNILFHLRKNKKLDGYEFGGLIVKKGEQELFILKVLKKPAETAPIPGNVNTGTAPVIPGEEQE